MHDISSSPCELIILVVPSYAIALLLFLIVSVTDPHSIYVQGATFADVMQMTDIFEGSIIRAARRLDEFLNQVKNFTIFKFTGFHLETDGLK